MPLPRVPVRRPIPHPLAVESVRRPVVAAGYAACLGLCVLATGCSDASRAVCVGRLEGRNGPIKSGVVSLVPLDKGDEPVIGELERDGKFEVLTADLGLVPVGRYRIEYTGASGPDAAFAGWPVTPTEILVHRGQNYLDLELVPPADSSPAH
ncbi:MAG TPA: hypothetical protein VHB77_09780 [Planctomycetaceae bacterium]|nr:hypothetical protein [Planctomycetaceae bacterium]